MGIFRAENALEATDSDLYVKFNIEVVMLTSKLCAPARVGWCAFWSLFDDRSGLKEGKALKTVGIDVQV